MPNHVIRDRIWQSRKLRRCSLNAALAYPWMLLVSDDWGRFEYVPRVIWGQCFAAREDVTLEMATSWLEEYEREGLLKRYHMDGELAYWIGFIGQRKDKRRPSQLPAPEQFNSVRTISNSWTEQRNVTEQNITERSGKAAVSLDIPEARAVIDAYNRVLGCSIGYTDGNLKAASRGLAKGYTLSQYATAFECIRDKSTSSGKWANENNSGFEYVTRLEYTDRKTGQLKFPPLIAIPNELASTPKPQTVGSGIAAERLRGLAEIAKKAANA